MWNGNNLPHQIWIALATIGTLAKLAKVGCTLRQQKNF